MNIRLWTGFLALGLIGVMAACAEAQPGGNRGGRGFGFGGGFGGGFSGGAPSAINIAGIAAVQKELNVTEEQAGKLRALGEEVRAKMQQGAGSGESLRDLPEEERRAKFAELAAKRAETARKVNDELKPKLAEILDDKQMERLNQIVLQQSGPQVYANPDVVKALKLSKDQQEKLASITKEYGDKSREMFSQGGGGGDFQERMTKMRELNTARDKELAEVLTEDQRTQLADMKGKSFEMPRGGFGGGREGGGRRPGGEGRPPRGSQE